MRGTGVRDDLFQQAQKLVAVALADLGDGKVGQRVDVDRFDAHSAGVGQIGLLLGQEDLSQRSGSQAGQGHPPQFQGVAAVEGRHSWILSESSIEAVKNGRLFFYGLRNS
jgi:hypothetical protein